MSGTFRPRLLHDVSVRPSEPQAVVEAFLAALAGPDLPGAAALLDEEVTYVNVGLPPIHGRRRTVGVLMLHRAGGAAGGGAGSPVPRQRRCAVMPPSATRWCGAA